MTPKLMTLQFSVKQIACGLDHTAILTTNGNLYMMGSNFDGKLGFGDKTSTKNQMTPKLLDSLLGP
jgi:alpha-tubulin suppressor-like RCC1 family protein